MTGFRNSRQTRAHRWAVKLGMAFALALPQMGFAQSTSQQLIVPGTAVPRGSGSKAMQAAEAEAKLSASKFAWNRLRGRSDFNAASSGFTPDQNAQMAQAMVELCNFIKLEESKDKSTKALTIRFSMDCPTQDLLGRASELKAAARVDMANSLDEKPRDQFVYLFMSRRVADMTNSYNDGTNYRASQKRTELVSSQALEDGLVSRLNGFGLDAVSYADMVIRGCANIDNSQINREFSITPPGQSDYGLTTDTRGELIKSLRDACKAKFFALGAADVGVTGRDPVSGLPMGRVVVSVLVLDLRQVNPIVVARVRTNSSETGNDETMAEENAMAKAANDVGLKIATELRARGIQ